MNRHTEKTEGWWTALRRYATACAAALPVAVLGGILASSTESPQPVATVFLVLAILVAVVQYFGLLPQARAILSKYSRAHVLDAVRVGELRSRALPVAVLACVAATLAVIDYRGLWRHELAFMRTNQEKILAALDKVPLDAPARPRRPRGPDPSRVYSFPIGESPIDGSEDAWVTLITVGDFECPYCSRVNDTIDRLKKEYAEELRVVFKHNPLPFHKRAMPAALAAECAKEQNKFWEMHDVLFKNARALEDANLEKYAKQVGVDEDRWKSCYGSKKYEKRIKEDQRIAARLGARGTPAFFINGRFLSGAQPFSNFKTLIDEELAKAQNSGIAKHEYYAKTVMEHGTEL